LTTCLSVRSSLPAESKPEFKMSFTKMRDRGDPGDVLTCTCLAVLAAYVLERGEDPKIMSDGGFEADLSGRDEVWEQAFEDANKLLASSSSQAKPFDMSEESLNTVSFQGQAHTGAAGKLREVKEQADAMQGTLESLVDDPSVSDVVFEFPGGLRVYAIRKLVCRGSDYLRELLEDQPQDRKRKRGEEDVLSVPIKDLDPQGVLGVIKYLYCDRCELTDDLVCETLRAADQMKVEKLRGRCIDHFCARAETVKKTAGFQRLKKTAKSLGIEVLEAASARADRG